MTQDPKTIIMNKLINDVNQLIKKIDELYCDAKIKQEMKGRNKNEKKKDERGTNSV